MPKAKRFSMEQILAVQKMLRNLPPKKVGKTGVEAIECLAGSIRKAVKKGHSLKEIRDILVGEGIKVSLSRMAALMKIGEEADQKKEDVSTPGDRPKRWIAGCSQCRKRGKGDKREMAFLPFWLFAFVPFAFLPEPILPLT
jgi:hypothetical protein